MAQTEYRMPALQARSPEYHERWEDAYGANLYSDFAWLMADAEDWLTCQFPALNIPVWCDWDAGEDDPQLAPIQRAPHLTVGVFMPRHGYCIQWIAPATEAQAMEFRRLMLNIWAHRADTGFAR